MIREQELSEQLRSAFDCDECGERLRPDNGKLVCDGCSYEKTLQQL